MASDMCHDGAMDLRPYAESVHRQLAAAAETGGEDARALAERLAAPLESAVRLALQDALAAAVEEITCELAPGSVELRLRGRDPEFVVTPPPVGEPDSADEEHSPPPAALDAEDGVMSRINLRMPERLKARVEAAAAGEGLSVNAWLVRAAAAAVDRGDAGRRHGRALAGHSTTRDGRASPPPARKQRPEGLAMPTFETPEPISVSLELAVGDIRIDASDRTDTVVEVRPSDPTKKSRRECRRADPRRVRRRPAGRQGAEELEAVLALGRQRVDRRRDRTCRRARSSGRRGGGGTRCTPRGRLGDCRFKTRAGDIHIDDAGAVQLKTSVGDVTRGASRRSCRGHDELRRASDRQHRGAGRRQELQRRHVDR